MIKIINLYKKIKNVTTGTKLFENMKKNHKKKPYVCSRLRGDILFSCWTCRFGLQFCPNRWVSIKQNMRDLRILRRQMHIQFLKIAQQVTAKFQHSREFKWGCEAMRSWVFGSWIHCYIYNQWLSHYEFESRSWNVYLITHYMIKFVSDLR
jgi:hypothetical protein